MQQPDGYSTNSEEEKEEKTEEERNHLAFGRLVQSSPTMEREYYLAGE